MAVQKQKVILTDLLRNTIKDLRKSNGKRGDIISSQLGKGASYISQLENGKIREIEFDMLDKVFRAISNVSENQYYSYMHNVIYNVIEKISQKELLYPETWIHIYIMQIFETPISDNIIDIIKEKLEQNYISTQNFITMFNAEQRHNRHYGNYEPNKLFVSIHTENFDNYYISTDILCSLPLDYLDRILSKEITRISYIFMGEILKTLYSNSKYQEHNAYLKTDKILFDNGFFNTIEVYENLHNTVHTQTPYNIPKDKKASTFKFYDDVIVDYDRKFDKLKNETLAKTAYAFDCYKEQNEAYACDTMEKILENMDNDLGLVTALLALPLNAIPNSEKKSFYTDCKSMVDSYIKHQPQ